MPYPRGGPRLPQRPQWQVLCRDSTTSPSVQPQTDDHRQRPHRSLANIAHADRTAQDHASRDTVMHVGRQIDDFTAYTWYEHVDASDHRSQQGLMDLVARF